MTTLNGSKTARVSRPSLSQQIDRLDAVLDGLSDALNESVAQAVRESVGQAAREAVAEALMEALASPAVARLAKAMQDASAAPQPVPAAPPAPRRRTLRESLGGALGWLCAVAGPPAASAGGALSWAWSGVLAGLRGAASAVVSASRGVAAVAAMAWSRPGSAVAVAAAATGAATLSWLGGHLASVLMCATGGAALALSATLLLPLGRAAAEARSA